MWESAITSVFSVQKTQNDLLYIVEDNKGESRERVKRNKDTTILLKNWGMNEINNLWGPAAERLSSNYGQISQAHLVGDCWQPELTKLEVSRLEADSSGYIRAEPRCCLARSWNTQPWIETRISGWDLAQLSKKFGVSKLLANRRWGFPLVWLVVIKKLQRFKTGNHSGRWYSM